MPAQVRPLSIRRSDFPDEFRFGVSTSSFQIEGSRFGGCGRSHWDAFCAAPGAISDSSNGETACAHIQHWQKDVEAIAELGFDSYRFSISWPRLFPKFSASPNLSGIDFYDRLLDALLERDIQPWACLYHWDLPQYLAAKGGWTNADIAPRFRDYAGFVAQKFGDRLSAVATLNEPWCIAWQGHFYGHHAPGQTDLGATAHALHNLLRAHSQATTALRDEGVGNVGIIVNLEPATPQNESPADHKAAELHDAFHNRWFLDALFKGTYPDDALEYIGERLPERWEEDMKEIATPLDWLGINYYSTATVGASTTSQFPPWRNAESRAPKTEMGWPIVPDGLREVIAHCTGDYTKEIPLYVTENGLGTMRTEDPTKDEDRISYFDQHLQAVSAAINDGANVRGYIAWSLMDNFEWAQGYEPRFGLMHVDFETQKRTPKHSAVAWQAFLADC